MAAYLGRPPPKGVHFALRPVPVSLGVPGAPGWLASSFCSHDNKSKHIKHNRKTTTGVGERGLQSTFAAAFALEVLSQLSFPSK